MVICAAQRASWICPGRPADRDELAHRGPDDAGIYVDGAVGLASRRLAIIDLSERGHQPMSHEEGEVWITRNGVVCNLRELREDLVRLGHRFRSATDTEVILGAYKEWGEGCLDRLTGMSAFAIWDSPRRKLFTARDRLGVKPFYYAISNGRMVFASEVHELCRYVSPSLDRIGPTSLDYYLAFGSVPPDRAFVGGIEKLPPAHALTSAETRSGRRRHWQLAPRPLRRTRFGEALELLPELFVDRSLSPGDSI